MRIIRGKKRGRGSSARRSSIRGRQRYEHHLEWTTQENSAAFIGAEIGGEKRSLSGNCQVRWRQADGRGGGSVTQEPQPNLRNENEAKPRSRLMGNIA
jgi:hypothetical protein